MSNAMYGRAPDSQDCADWVLVAPLLNFSSAVARVDLDNGILLGELHGFFPQLYDASGRAEPFYEVNEAVDQLLRKLAPMSAGTGTDVTHGVGTLVSLPAEQSPDLGDAIDTFVDVIASLRLVKSGAVHFPCVLAYRQFEGDSDTLTLESAVVLSSGTKWALLPVEGEPYSLEPNEISLLKRIHHCMRTRHDERINFALRRFDLAHERSRQEDRLVDLFVALEALFMNPWERREIRAQLSYRVAWLLGESFDEIQSLHATAKRLYRDRSDVVHGSPPENIGAALAETEDLVRRSLFRAVTNPASVVRVRERKLSSGNGRRS